MEALFREHKICAIFRGIPKNIFLPYAKALYDGGIRLFEVSMTDPDAEKEITWLKEELQKDAVIGAGTIIDREAFFRAESVQAAFYLSPSADTEILELCQKKERKLIPGVLTPSDISKCIHFGFYVLKLFPVSEVTDGYVHQLKGPFAEVEFIAVGGVRLANIKNKINAGYIGVGIGNGMIRENLIKEKQWGMVTESVKEALCLFK